MADRSKQYPRGNGTVGESAFAITPDDAADLAFIPRTIYVGGAGDLAVIPWNEGSPADAVTFVGMAAGSFLPLRVSRVLATGTTATNIVGID